MVTGERIEKLAASLRVRHHQVISGVSQKSGGADEGMDPHELLEAALAACTMITVQMYANRKQWDLISVDVIVKIVSESDTPRITREISFRGKLSEEQRSRLLEIADKCPIHRLLERSIEIETIELGPV